MYSVDQKIMSRNYTIAGGGVPLASFPCAASMAFNFAALSFAASVADKLALPVQSSSVDGTSHLLFLLSWNDRKHSKTTLDYYILFQRLNLTILKRMNSLVTYTYTIFVKELMQWLYVCYICIYSQKGPCFALIKLCIISGKS